MLFSNGDRAARFRRRDMPARRHTEPASADDADALQGIARMAVYGRLKDYSGGVLRKAGSTHRPTKPASTDALQCMILRFRNF